MTKEQILEKIEVPPFDNGDFKTTASFPDAERLASYLATIEERLERVEGKGEVVFSGFTCGRCKGTGKEETFSTSPWCVVCAGQGRQFYQTIPTPTECEHKHRGLYGECLKCTEKLDDSPTEVKDWEVRFDEHMNAHKAFDLYHLETAKSFIRNLLK
jgi:hypothetical protein